TSLWVTFIQNVVDAFAEHRIQYCLLLIIIKLGLQSPALSIHCLRLLNFRAQFEHAIFIVLIESAADRKIGEVYPGTCHQVNITMDARKSPVVLVFQIAAVTPADHLHGKGVLPLLYIRTDVELSRQATVFAITYLLSVHPHIEGRTDASKMQRYIFI